MSQKDLSAFGNRFSAGRATAGSTFTTVNENVQVLGSLSVGSGLNITGSSSFGDLATTSVNVNSGKTLIDSNGNIVSLGGLSLSGVATMNSIQSSGQIGMQSLNVNSGKLSIDSNGNLSSIGNIGVTGNATFSSLNATGAVSVGGNATMLGPLYANQGIDVNSGKLTVDTNGHLVSQGNVSALGTLSVGGVATFGNAISASGVAYLNSVNVNGGKFTVDSQGNVAALGALSVTGNATFSNINVSGAASVAGNLNMAGNISANGSLSGGSLTVTGATSLNTLGLNSVSVNSGKFTIDSNGNVVSLGALSLSGAATMSSTLAVAGASSFANSVNVQSGKFVIDSSGNIGIGSNPSGAVVDIYNNSSRIRMRGTGTGIEWNNSGSAVLSSMIYDTDSKLKMYSSATANPKMSLDSSNVIIMHNPTQALPALSKYTAITPIGILTITARFVVNVTQSGSSLDFGNSGTAIALIGLAKDNPKSYIYIDDDLYRDKLLYCISSTVTNGLPVMTFTDVLTGTTVSQTASLSNTTVYVVSAIVTNDGKFLSTVLVSPDGNPRVVVSNQYGQLSLSA